MIKIEYVETWGFKHAIRGMRNPMNSWDKSDSSGNALGWYVGPNDLDLMQRLYKAGPSHRKYLRQIFVSMDVVAPLYWWKEMDTYKIGVTANSCSTMHKLTEKKFDFDDFSHDKMDEQGIRVLMELIGVLNVLRGGYLRADAAAVKAQFWWNMIQFLPSSYNQRRTITMSYENAANIIEQRSGHKLDEWKVFTNELKKLPYLAEIMGGPSENEN